jgi:hypothetical protein
MSLRRWLLDRAFGRLRISPDIVRHLSTLQRLGENIEVEWPKELLPSGARQVFRALRTRAAVQITSDWVWPYWVEAQLDRTSDSFVPRGHLPFLTNLTHRNWTATGVLGSDVEATVDPHGLVTPWFDGPSLDWWVRGPGGWQYPSQAGDVAQALVDNAPVVRTVMPVAGGGKVVATTYGAVAAAVRSFERAGSNDELVVHTVKNATDAPVAIGFAVRPYNPEGLAVVEDLTVSDDVVLVDGRPFLYLIDGAPRELRMSTFRAGDVARDLAEPAVAPEHRVTHRHVSDPAGLATAVLVYPVEHGGSVAVAMPMHPQDRVRRRGPLRRRAEKAHAPRADQVPSAAAVVRGWRIQTRRAATFILPDEAVTDAIAAQAGYLLLAHDGNEITPGPATYHRFWFRDAAFILRGLGHLGFHKEVAQVIASYPKRQRRDGFFFSQRQEWDANGAAIMAIADHWRLTRDRATVEPLLAAVRSGVRWIARATRPRPHVRPEAVGLLPAGISAEHLGPFDVYYWDAFMSLRGLRDAAMLGADIGDAALAADAEAAHARLDQAIAASTRRVAERLGEPLMPAGPFRNADAGMIGSLAGCYPLEVLDPADPRVRRTRAEVESRYCDGARFFQGINHTGYGTYLSLHLAGSYLRESDPRAWDYLRVLVASATPTWTWPEAIHPRTGGGCMGDGHHAWAAGEFVSFVRNCCVREVPGGLALCSVVPEAWRGGEIVVQRAPTAYGQIDMRLTWRGDTPILQWRGLWGRRTPTLTAPALDAGFRTTEPAGTATLAPLKVG